MVLVVVVAYCSRVPKLSLLGNQLLLFSPLRKDWEKTESGRRRCSVLLLHALYGGIVLHADVFRESDAKVPHISMR